MNHHMEIRFTGSPDWPYQARCRCGWMSIGHRTATRAKAAGREHDAFANAYDDQPGGAA